MPITISGIHFSRVEVMRPLLYTPSPVSTYTYLSGGSLMASAAGQVALATYIKNDLRPPPVKYLEDFSQFLMMMMAAGSGTKLLAPLQTPSGLPLYVLPAAVSVA